MPSLVIQLARMGDLLQTRRLLAGLAQNDDVHLLVDESLGAFARMIFPFATVHEIAAHGAASQSRSSSPDAQSGSPESCLEHSCQSRLEPLLPQLAALRAYNFSRIYNLNYSGLNLALSTLWEPSRLRGHWLERGQERRSAWLGLAFRWAAQRRSAPLNLMDLWGLLAPCPLHPEQVNPAASPKGGGLGVMLAGRMARRSIPPELLALHVAALCQRMGWPEVTLFGSSSEQSLAKALMRAMPTAVLAKTRNLAGKTSLKELAGQVAGLDRMLTPDTGGMHLAAHYGVPVEAFFLSSAWAHETGPYGMGHLVWQAFSPCLPCLESENCLHKVQCLNVFSDSKFLQLLSRFRDDWPPPEGCRTPGGLLCLKTGFDRLGVLCRHALSPHHDTAAEIAPHDSRRLALREVLAEYNFGKLGEYALMQADMVAPHSDIPEKSQICGQFFRESDWMLPQDGQDV
ncbi:MAG: glycosyltransferase family 9 protein [Desulfovibrionaceae bacterium]|nr:glycosyltransferase family 9 protein [Desulfovibrionaceae bacterium]